MKYRDLLLAGALLAPLSLQAAPQGMPKEAWLKNFMPSEVSWHCNDIRSPIKRDFKGTIAECTDKVSQLFVSCTESVDNVVIPDVLISRQQAVKFGSIVGECIGAYYFGGDHLEAFNAAQKQT